jgi:SurA-like protein/PPIC-type peptidyl-prolyl cis-trans isomerase-like protein
MFHGRRGVVAVVCLLFVNGCSSNKPVPSPKASPVIARVANETITLAQFTTRYNSALVSIEQGGGPKNNATQTTQLRTTILGSLIIDTVIKEEATALGLEATPAEIQAQVNADAASDGGMSALETDLAGAGGSIAQLEDEISSDLNEQRLEDNFAKARAATIEQILATGTFSAAKFIATAKTYSDDTGTSAKGGDLGILTKDELTTYDPAFATAVEGLAVGSYTTTPVHDAGGYDIVMLYSESSKGFGVRHILVYAGNPYDVMDRPNWFAESLFSQIATLCQQNEIEVTLTNAGGSPCTRALESPTPSVATPKATPKP